MADQGHDAKLAQFQAQLLDVEKLIRIDPTNAEYQSLKKDLLELIDLTARAAKDVGNAATAAAVAPVEAPVADDEDEPAPPLPPTVFEVGATVEAQYNDVWYPVRILSEDAAANSFEVQFLTFEERKGFQMADLRPLQGIVEKHSDHLLEVGTAVAARYSVDRVIYAAQIETVTERGYFVHFTQYGNKEEVPVEWVTTDLTKVGGGPSVPSALPTTTTSNDAAGQALKKKNVASRKRKKAEEARKAEMLAQIKEIPESLKVTATDSEQEKKKKNRIKKKLKANNRAVKIEMAQNDRASSWQKFAMKTKKKKAKGSLMGLRKKSIFASPDTIDGRVGVTGSGNGMTDFQDRKKYKLNVG